MRRQPSLRRIQSDPNFAFKVHARRTRIVCTIGPKCNDHETLKAMVRPRARSDHATLRPPRVPFTHTRALVGARGPQLKAGMNVARLNFSHGDHKTHLENIEAIRKACEATSEDAESCGLPLCARA